MIDLIPALLALVSGGLLVGTAMAGAGAFYRLALRSVSVLDVFLDEDLDEEARHGRVVANLGPLVRALLLFVMYGGAVVLAGLVPLGVYAWVTGADYTFATEHPLWFWSLFSLGAIVPTWMTARRTPSGSYSALDKLFHRLTLDNRALARRLFRWETRRPHPPARRAFTVVSGLARTGTTALARMLTERGDFHSLSYAQMPLLLAPRLWARVHRPEAGEGVERSHGDGIRVGARSVEALEEYFWLNFLGETYAEPSRLSEHDVPDEVYRDYLRYQATVIPPEAEGQYLAKNNNFLLRYAALRRLDPDFFLLLLFRHPLDHAASLMRIDERFSQQQREDPFVLEYMGWLGHHEFGLDYRPFHFSGQEPPEAGPRDMNHWLRSWQRYYSRAADFLGDERFVPVRYEDLAADPADMLRAISAATGVSIRASDLEAHVPAHTHDPQDADPALLGDCLRLYGRLAEAALRPAPASRAAAR